MEPLNLSNTDLVSIQEGMNVFGTLVGILK